MGEFIYRGRKIRSASIFGLGRSGVGVLKFLLKKHPQISITLRDDKPTLNEGIPLRDDFKIYLGGMSEHRLNEDIIFLTPTIRRDRFLPTLYPRITSDAELYFELSRNRIFSISGSDGKSTTATLASLLLSGGGTRVSAIGNIGVPFLPHLRRGIAPPAVAELSSFQLLSFIPHSKRAVITNISENHLDFHKDMTEYISAKENLLIGADEPVFNYDDELSRALMSRYSPYAVYSASHSLESLHSAVSADVYFTIKDGFILRNGVRIFDTGRLKVKNIHRVINMMSAMALCDGYYTREWCESVGGEFSGLSHRCECVGTFSGVSYINSSIDTTPTRTRATLLSLPYSVHLILGGRDKGLSFEPLVEPILKRCKSVTIYGECAEALYEYLSKSIAIKDCGIPLKRLPDFTSAVFSAISRAEAGDTVILSPSMASYDAFSSFEERGERFKEIIRNHYYKRTM